MHCGTEQDANQRLLICFQYWNVLDSQKNTLVMEIYWIANNHTLVSKHVEQNSNSLPMVSTNAINLNCIFFIQSNSQNATAKCNESYSLIMESCNGVHFISRLILTTAMEFLSIYPKLSCSCVSRSMNDHLKIGYPLLKEPNWCIRPCFFANNFRIILCSSAYFPSLFWLSIHCAHIHTGRERERGEEKEREKQREGERRKEISRERRRETETRSTKNPKIINRAAICIVHVTFQFE